MAANADSRQLQLQISASAELLIRNLKTADNAVAEFQRQTDGRLSSIDRRFEALGALKGKLAGLDTHIGVGGLASAATGATLIALAQRGLDYASSLQEVSQQLGVTSRDLQVYRYAASQVGVEQEDVDKGLQKLTLTMGKAEAGAKGPIAAFKAVGLSVADLKGKTAGDVIPAIADALAKIGDPAQRAAIEVELFGKAGQKLDTLLAGGRGQIDDLAAAAQRLGLVLSTDEIANADAAADKLSEVKQVLEAGIAHTVVQNAEAILQLADAIETLIVTASRTGPIDGFLRILSKDGVGAAARSFFDLSNQFGADQQLASTARGYTQLKINQRNSAVSEYKGARRDPAASPARVAELAQRALDADRDARKAISDYRADRARARGERGTARSQVVTGTGGSSLDLSGGNGGKGKSAEQIAREAQAAAKKDRAEQRRAHDAVARADLDVLSARADLSNDPEQRLQIERQRIDLARQARDADLDDLAVDNQYIAVNLDRLKKANLLVATLDKDLAAQRVAQQNDQAEYDRRRGAQDDAIALDEIAASLTVVARDRRAIERRILAAKQREEREALERISANVAGRFKPQEVLAASDALTRLPRKHAAQSTALEHEQQGPFDNYRDQLRAASDDTSAALEAIAVRGFGRLEDAGSSAIASSVADLLQLKGVAGEVVGSIIADLARLAIQKAIVAAIGGSFFGFADGGQISDTPGFASGGSLGGLISGPGTGKSDSILALLRGPGGGAVRLSNREFIMNEGAVDFYGADTMAAINARRLPRFAGGGSLSGGSLPALRAPQLGNLGGRGANDRLAVDVTARVDASPLLLASVQQTTVRTVGAAAEPIMAGAESRTMRRLSRVGLPGAPG